MVTFKSDCVFVYHRWRNKVAKRLIKEAGVRQIVVFTHDLIFVNDLHELANESGVSVSLANLTRAPNGVGVVNENLPWDKSGVPQRIDNLDRVITALCTWNSVEAYDR